MLFYELACHPEVFNKEYLLENSVAIKEIFKNITEKGSIANLNNGKWELIIQEKVAALSEDVVKETKLKLQLQKILKTLQTRRKIIQHNKLEDGTDWLKIIYAEKEDFSAIIHIQTTHDTYDAEDLLDSKLWEELTKTSSGYAIQDEEYIKSEIGPILHNARRIDIIDPYFDITKDQYKKPLQIILAALSNKDSRRQVSLSIHIKNQNNNNEDAVDRPNYLEKWQDTFKNNSNHNVKCTLYVWEETSKDTMHDRYIIRDESFCAVLPSGIDKRKKNKTVWSDIGYHNIDNVLNDFREESSPFKLVAKVVAEDIYILFRGILQSKNNQKNETIETNIETPLGLKIKERRR